MNILEQIAASDETGPFFTVTIPCRKCGGFVRYKDGKCRDCKVKSMRHKWATVASYKKAHDRRRSEAKKKSTGLRFV